MGSAGRELSGVSKNAVDQLRLPKNYWIYSITSVPLPIVSKSIQSARVAQGLLSMRMSRCRGCWRRSGSAWSICPYAL